MWQVKKAKDAVQEEIESGKKYRYPSIDALYNSLDTTYRKALATKEALDKVTGGKNLEDVTGRHAGAFTGNWALASFITAMSGEARSLNPEEVPTYTIFDAYQDDARKMLYTLAEKDAQALINSAWADIAKVKSAVELQGFIKSLDEVYAQKRFTPEETVSKEDNATVNEKTPLWRLVNGEIKYKKDIGKIDPAIGRMAPDYASAIDSLVIPQVRVAAQAYAQITANTTSAQNFLENNGEAKFSFQDLEKLGFTKNKNGIWEQKKLTAKATDEERSDQVSNFRKAHAMITSMTSSIRTLLGGQEQLAINVLKAAGIPEALYTNEPDYKDEEPFNANGISFTGDDGGAGGNYSGTGKLSSAAPKQVIVNIGNLLEVKTIDLLKSPEGQTAEIQNLKEQLAQALIDTVHDFDASWNG